MNVNALTGALGMGTVRLVRSTIGKTALVQTAERQDTRIKNRRKRYVKNERIEYWRLVEPD